MRFSAGGAAPAPPEAATPVVDALSSAGAFVSFSSRLFSPLGRGAQRPDWLADDAVRSETVSRPVLPAICDLQGDFQKLQGE